MNNSLKRDIDVEYVLHEIVQVLATEDENVTFTINSNSKGKTEANIFNTESAVTPSAKGYAVTDTCSSPESFENFRLLAEEGAAKSSDHVPKLSDNYEITDSSSILEDASTPKAVLNNECNELSNRNEMQATAKTTETDEDNYVSQTCAREIDADNFQSILTSTPKKKCDNTKNHSLGDSSNECEPNSKENSSQSSEKDEFNDYLDRTIDMAITKYETNEEKFREASVQTNFDDPSICAVCSSTAKAPVPVPVPEIVSPPLKKLKIEDSLIEAVKDDEYHETMELMDSRLAEAEDKPLRRATFTYFTQKYPMIGSKGIIVDEVSSGKWTRIPRIRVGLSKRARLHIKN